MYITDNKMFDSKFGGNKKRENQIVYMSDACVTYTNSEEKRN